MKQILANINIPPLPTSIIEIEAIVNSSDFEISKMANIINKDAALVAYVLKRSNSPLYGLSRTINSTNTAISMFGKQEVKAWIYSIVIRGSFERDIISYGIDSEYLAELSGKQSAFAGRWAKMEFPEIKEKLSFFTFMMELGKIPFSFILRASDKNNEFLSKFKEAEQNEIAFLEKEFIGATSYEFSSFLFDKWNMDDELVNVMKFIDYPEMAEEELSLAFDDKKLALELTKITKALHIIKSIFSLKILNDEEINDILKKAKAFGFNTDNITQLLAEFTASKWGCFYLFFCIKINKKLLILNLY